MSAIIPPPADVRAMRIAAGLTQSACAKRFGVKLRDWQRREDGGPNGSRTSIGEWELLQLIADQHPNYRLMPR